LSGGATHPSQGTDTIPPTLGKYFLQSLGLAAARFAGAVSGAAAIADSFLRPLSLSIALCSVCCSVVGFSEAKAGTVSQSTGVGASAASVRHTPPTSCQRDAP